MKDIRITVMRKACYRDLMAQYENPPRTSLRYGRRAGVHRPRLGEARGTV